MSFVVSLVSAAMGTDEDTGPQDHREDEDGASSNHDECRELK
jgi:hypothetical protein